MSTTTKLNTASKPRMTSEERRAAIIEAARHLFAEKGFRGTTTRELASAVGVTEPVLYEHFRTKGDLYSALIGEQAKAGLAYSRGSGREILRDGRRFRLFHRLGQRGYPVVHEDPTFIRLLLFSNLEGHELKDLFTKEATNASTLSPVISSVVSGRRHAAGKFENGSTSIFRNARTLRNNRYGVRLRAFQGASRRNRGIYGRHFHEGMCKEDAK